MKLIKCPTCEKEIAKSAKVCPGCGAKMKSSKVKRGVIAVGILFIIMLIVNSLGASGLPACDSSSAISLVVDKLNEKSQTGDEMKDIGQVTELSHTDTSRTCTGVTVGNYPARAMIDTLKIQYTLHVLNTGDLDAEVSMAR